MSNIAAEQYHRVYFTAHGIRTVCLRFTNTYRTLMFTPTLLSVVIIGFIWKLILSPTWGVAKSMLGAVGLGSLFAPWLGQEGSALFTLALISVWQWVGMPLLLTYAALLNIPDSLNEAAREYKALHETLQGLNETQMTEVWLGTWSVRDIVAHIAGWHQEMSPALERLARGERPVPEGVSYEDVDGWNERCEPFLWTKDPDTILAKAKRQTSSDTRH